MSNRTWTRRSFVQLASGAAASAVTARAFGAETIGAGLACYRDYRRRLEKQPWLAALGSIDVDYLPPKTFPVSGRIPEGLLGTLYRNGPTGRERAGLRYQHLFDGDGMVQAFRFQGQSVRHWGRMVRTQKRVRELEAGKFLYGGAGSRIPNALAARNNDTTNPANISVVPFDGELLALWEAGSPYAVDPDDLQTRRRIDWSSETARLPFSAHPVRDEDGSLWNFGLAQWVQNGVLLLYRVEPGKGLTRWGRFDLPFAGYIHSFAATQRWLVFYLSPNLFDSQRARHYVQQHQWRPDLGGRVLLVDKNDFSKTKLLDAPAGFVFHMINATEYRDGTVRFQACWHDTADVMNEHMSRLSCGETSPMAARLVTVIVPPKGQVRVDRYDVNGEFLVRGGSPNTVYVPARKKAGPWLDRIAAVDLNTAKVQWTTTGAGELVEEHLFVPNPKTPRRGGWLVGTSFDTKKKHTVLNVFDCLRLSEGPVARAHLDRAIPLGFHGCFVPGAV